MRDTNPKPSAAAPVQLSTLKAGDKFRSVIKHKGKLPSMSGIRDVIAVGETHVRVGTQMGRYLTLPASTSVVVVVD